MRKQEKNVYKKIARKKRKKMRNRLIKAKNSVLKKTKNIGVDFLKKKNTFQKTRVDPLLALAILLS